MKIRILKLTLEQLAGLLQGTVSLSFKLPSDLEVLDVKIDLFTKQVSLVVRSETFENIAEFLPFPELNFSSNNALEKLIEAYPTPTTKPVNSTVTIPKVEIKQDASPAVAKSLQLPAGRYAAKMENEFSPDQRKLLNFTVKEDSMVVKPVTFLKTEWDDINEVVRSLGGRWVKGDIISYWEIPLQ